MATQSFGTWATAVVTVLKEEGSELWEDVLDTHKPPRDATDAEILEYIRGDESQEAYETDELAADYAEFLLSEWDLYGPEGE